TDEVCCPKRFGQCEHENTTGDFQVETIKLKSPIDGSIYLERPVATDAEIDAVVARARAAQVEWANTSIAQRSTYLLAFLEALLAMNDEIVPEIAWQMCRPVRYGGEMGGVE